MSIWEDSIHEMLSDTVNELASQKNYSSETTNHYKLIEEAFCRKALTSKLDENLKVLEQLSAGEAEQEQPSSSQ